MSHQLKEYYKDTLNYIAIIFIICSFVSIVYKTIGLAHAVPVLKEDHCGHQMYVYLCIQGSLSWFFQIVGFIKRCFTESSKESAEEILAKMWNIENSWVLITVPIASIYHIYVLANFVDQTEFVKCNSDDHNLMKIIAIFSTVLDWSFWVLFLFLLLNPRSNSPTLPPQSPPPPQVGEIPEAIPVEVAEVAEVAETIEKVVVT